MTDATIYFAENPILLILYAGVLGMVVGSFLNVVIYRLPKMLEREWQTQCSALLNIEQTTPSTIFNLLSPNSHCPHCQKEITPWHNIPVISYIFLKAKCYYCKTPIALRYPALEFSCGVLTAFTAYYFGFTLTLFVGLIFLWSLIALTMIDIDHQLLPDNITLPLLWGGLLINSFNVLVPLQEAVIGAMMGYLSLWSVYWFFKLLTNKEGMGYGDFKLLAALGAWLGWEMLPLIIVLSSLTGACVGVLLIVFKKYSADTAIPFGPYLAIAGFVAFLWGDTLTAHYWLLLNF